MSSISTYKDKSGGTLRAVQFCGADKKRRTIRCGALPSKDVDHIKGHIDTLEACRKHGQQPNADIVAWLGRLDTSVYDTLAAGGLVSIRMEKQKGLTLGAFLEVYLRQREQLVPKDLSARTLEIEKVTADCLTDKFTSTMPMAEFTEGHAEDFRTFLLSSGGRPVKKCGSETVIFIRKPLSQATTRKRCSIAAKMFGYAVRRKFIGSNPFHNENVPRANIASKRSVYVSAADANAVLDKLPDTQWRLLFVLARWGGLRIGETRLITWGDVLWDENKVNVHSPKTAHHEGHESRLIPLWPELAKALSERYDEAGDGEQHVLPMLQNRSDASLRKTMERAIKLAGVKTWTRMWHSLRGSRQNELLEANFKAKAVCEWLGNNAATAAKHYEKLTEADWAMATAPLNAPLAENVARTR